MKQKAYVELKQEECIRVKQNEHVGVRKKEIIEVKQTQNMEQGRWIKGDQRQAGEEARKWNVVEEGGKIKGKKTKCVTGR